MVMSAQMISIYSNIKKHLQQFGIAGSLLCLYAVAAGGCQKLIDINTPKNQLVTSTVFESDKTANSAVAGMYSTISNKITFNLDITSLNSMSAGELSYAGTNLSFDQFRDNTIAVVNNSSNLEMWTDAYSVIYQANSIIEGLANGTVSDSLKVQYTGEAKFIRAYCYFYLVNMYGPVPLITATDITKSALAPRTSVADVYRQIITDLLDAQSKLATDYTYSSGDRTRANKWAATALLARAYLYQGQWANAETAATAVIANSGLYSLVPDLTTGSPFYKNNTEAIWQFYSYVGPASGYTNEGLSFFPATLTFYSLSKHLTDAFEDGDKRKTAWIKSYTYLGSTYSLPYKYKFNTAAAAAAAGKLEFATLLRLSEQYLIRAETRAQQNNIDGAATDLNIIRKRAGLSGTEATDQHTMLLAIEQERQVELCFEYGHRWFDLKRTNRADAILGVLKSNTWKSTAVLYPVPQEAINTNANLLPQNGGY